MSADTKSFDGYEQVIFFWKNYGIMRFNIYLSEHIFHICIDIERVAWVGGWMGVQLMCDTSPEACNRMLAIKKQVLVE